MKEFRKNTKIGFLKLLFCVVLCLGFYGVIKLLFVIFPVTKLKPDNTWIKTVGTITKYAVGRSGKGYIHYRIGGIDYREINMMNSYGRTLGEKYIILVNPKNQHEYITMEPVFLKSEATATCIGKITRTYAFDWGETDSFSTNHGIEYSYIINDVEYETAQDLPPEYTGIYKWLKKGDVFRVEYLIANPQRSIMYFDKIPPGQPGDH